MVRDEGRGRRGGELVPSRMKVRRIRGTQRVWIAMFV